MQKLTRQIVLHILTAEDDYMEIELLVWDSWYVIMSHNYRKVFYHNLKVMYFCVQRIFANLFSCSKVLILFFLGEKWGHVNIYIGEANQMFRKACQMISLMEVSIYLCPQYSANISLFWFCSLHMNVLGCFEVLYVRLLCFCCLLRIIRSSLFTNLQIPVFRWILSQTSRKERYG